MKQEAIEKIRREQTEVMGLGSKAKAMAKPVAKKLCDFCGQDEEFAQAVLQGGSFGQCMKELEKKVGDAISDEEAYAKAVRFYFPGARIKVQMTIDLVGDAADATEDAGGVEPSARRKSGVVLDLMDFLG